MTSNFLGMTPDDARRIRIVQRVREFFKDETKVRAWLYTHNPLLGGLIPSELWETDRGLDKVEKFVEQQLAENAPRLLTSVDAEQARIDRFRKLFEGSFSLETHMGRRLAAILAAGHGVRVTCTATGAPGGGLSVYTTVDRLDYTQLGHDWRGRGGR